MKRRVGMLAIVTLLAACSNSQSSPVSQQPQQPQSGTFALQTQPAGAGEQRVTLRALSTAGTVITFVGQLNYDTTRLAMKGCEVSSQGAAAGKTLHVAEPRPGTVRAVVEGGLQPLPDGSDVLSCTFAAAPGAPGGPVTVHAEGNVSDMSFVARSFVTEGTVDVRN